MIKGYSKLFLLLYIIFSPAIPHFFGKGEPILRPWQMFNRFGNECKFLLVKDINNKLIDIRKNKAFKRCFKSEREINNFISGLSSNAFEATIMTPTKQGLKSKVIIVKDYR